MRLTAVLILISLASLLVPAAAAQPEVADLNELQAGECTVRWSYYWPDETVGARCSEDGQTIVAFSYGTCALGHYVYVQVDDHSVYLPCNTTPI